MALDKNVGPFFIYMTFFNLSLKTIYLAKETSIDLLLAKKVKIPAKYLAFLNVFLEKKAFVLSELTELYQPFI